MKRAGIALIGLAAAVAIGSPAGADAGTAMHGCTHKPHIPGFKFVYLQERGLGCDHARELSLHTLRHGEPQHYKCTHKITPPNWRFVQWHCAHKDNHHGTTVRAFAFGYMVE